MAETGSGNGQNAWEMVANLWRAMQSVMDESAPALEALGISPKALFLLASVDEVPFPAELARIMHLPPPTVTYLVKQMEERGLLRRQPEPGDLRKFRLVLTPTGKDAIREGREAIGAVVQTRLGRVAKHEMAVFDRVVSLLADGPGDSG